MRNIILALVVFEIFATTSSPASAVVLYDATATADLYAAPPSGIDPSLGNPNGGYGGGLLTGDIGFTTLVAESLTFTVTDLGTTTNGRSGSVYQVVLDGSALGLTGPTAIDAATFSTGVFHAYVTAGFHDLGVWDFIATYPGFASPYGGTVDQDFTQANVSIQIAESVPEPGTMTLMGVGLAGLFGMVRDRRRARAAV